MKEDERLAELFDGHRAHLRAVAFRLLGSLEDADDAVQETWLRASGVDVGGVDNVLGWLTTIVSRISLDLLKSRRRSRAGREALQGLDLGSPTPSPEEAHALAESVGLAMLVVLERLGPLERVAFVLHDLLGLPFEDVARILDRTSSAAKKLASRARHRVRGSAQPPVISRRDVELVETFLEAARTGDLDALVAVIAPEVVRRVDSVARGVGVPAELRGAKAVAEETRGNAARARFARVLFIDGRIGAVVAPLGRLHLVLRFAIEGDRITAIDVAGEATTLERLELTLLNASRIPAGG